MHTHPENQYLELMRRILEEGTDQQDRTGTGTRSVFGHQMRFDLSQGFPLLTTKKLHFRSIALELLWFLRGETNVRWLQERGVSIWDEWADPQTGELGPIYGHQWRGLTGADGRKLDQIADLEKRIQLDPDSRRQIVTAWNVADLPEMKLSPCHCLFQTAVLDGKLHLQLYQRSADLFLGVPYNLASYALLLHILAKRCGLVPGEFIWTGGHIHLYHNHLEQAKLQLERTPLALPQLNILSEPALIDGYEFEDFQLLNYDAHPHIKAPVAV